MSRPIIAKRKLTDIAAGGYQTLRTGQRTAWSIFKMRLCRPKLMASGRMRPTTTRSAPISSAVSLIPGMTLPGLLSSFFELPRRSRACAIHSCDPASVPAALSDSSNQYLVGVWAVSVRSVDESDPKIQCSMDRCYRFRIIAAGVESAHSHTAKSDR